MNQSHQSHDFKLILILFITSRLMLLAALPPEAITAYGDYEHYFNLARLSSEGLLPFIDYWYEFPPLFPFLSIGLYQLTAASTGALHSYVYALTMVMLAFDVGCLILLYRLARHFWGERTALRCSWVFLALPVSLIYAWRTFDSMTTFWMLLALYWLLATETNRASQRWRFILSAVALGLGVMTKYVPVLLLPTVWILRPVKSALVYTAIVIAVVLLIFGPIIAANPDFGIASLKAQASKSSWQTIWALIDGNYGTGNFGPIAEHFDPALATKLQGRPERIPSWLTLIPFLSIGLAVFLRSRKEPGRSALPAAFFSLTFALFLLWSKGWSPQWQMMLFPLVLLAFPGRNGVLYCVLFGLISFVEWPVLLSRGMTEWLWLTVASRTSLLLGLAVASTRLLKTGNPGSSAGFAGQEGRDA